MYSDVLLCLPPNLSRSAATEFHAVSFHYMYIRDIVLAIAYYMHLINKTTYSLYQTFFMVMYVCVRVCVCVCVCVCVHVCV